MEAMDMRPSQRYLAGLWSSGNLDWADGVADAVEATALSVVADVEDLDELRLVVFDDVAERFAKVDEDAVWDICCDISHDIWKDVRGSAHWRSGSR